MGLIEAKTPPEKAHQPQWLWQRHFLPPLEDAVDIGNMTVPKKGEPQERGTEKYLCRMGRLVI